MKKKITPSSKKQTYYKCTHCGDEIFWNTHKKLTYCKCEKIAIDGCEYYVRVIGNEGDYKIVKSIFLSLIDKSNPPYYTASKPKNTTS